MDSKPKFLEYSSQQENSENFFAFLDYLEKNPIDYGHTYASLHDEIKAKKCPCKEIPSLQDLRQYFYCFLNYKWAFHLFFSDFFEILFYTVQLIYLKIEKTLSISQISFLLNILIFFFLKGSQIDPKRSLNTGIKNIFQF